MKNTICKIIWVSLLFSFYTLTVFSQDDIPDKPKPPRLVNDYTGTLSSSDNNKLERKLLAFNDTTSNQIAIVIVNSFNGYTKAEFASLLGHKWGVGQAGFDNGVVIVVRPKASRQSGEIQIAIGYGLEGAIPDAIANRITDYEMIPYFKNNDYYGGLDAGTNVLMSLAAGEYSSDEYAKKTGGSPFGYLVPFIVMLIIYIMIIRTSRKSYTTGGKKSNASLWTALWLGSMMGGGGRSHGGGFGGGGGGGFGGFGGGGFGGGGAGGSW